MSLIISSAFDAGNIRVVKQDGASADLEIVQDHLSDFYQWFYFRVAGGAGRELTLRITNCAGSAYPHGWPDYKAGPAAVRGLERLFRALFDGASPRPGHPDCCTRRGRVSLAGQEPGRA